MRIRFDRVRALVRAVHDIGDIAEPLARTAESCRVLAQVVGAELSAVVAMDDFVPGGHARVSAMVGYGWSEGVAKHILPVMQARGALVEPTVAALAASPARVVVARRADLVSDRDWAEHWFVHDHRRAAGLDDEMTGVVRGALPGQAVGVSLHRALGDRPFGLEERALLSLFVEDLAGLDGFGVEAARARLTPRERETLARLLAGASEKEIARDLDLSTHTVHEYVKSLHRKLGVQSRSQLVARVRGRAPLPPKA